MYDPAVAVKRAPHDAKAAIERTPSPILATCLSRWENVPWSEAAAAGRILRPTNGAALRRAPEIVVNALPVSVAGDEWFDVEGRRPRMRWRALALRNAGVTNPVITNWLNDWALQCREAQGRGEPCGTASQPAS